GNWRCGRSLTFQASGRLCRGVSHAEAAAWMTVHRAVRPEPYLPGEWSAGSVGFPCEGDWLDDGELGGAAGALPSRRVVGWVGWIPMRRHLVG
ncbi:hypothetical protein BVY04_03445, partial [bacterium M21]